MDSPIGKWREFAIPKKVKEKLALRDCIGFRKRRLLLYTGEVMSVVSGFERASETELFHKLVMSVSVCHPKRNSRRRPKQDELNRVLALYPTIRYTASVEEHTVYLVEQ